MVLAVPSWRSWCCSLPVCLHGLCCQAIPARERQREHGWDGTLALRQALFCVGWAGLGDTYWGILVWGAVVEGEVQLGGQHLSEATAGGAKAGPVSRRPYLDDTGQVGSHWTVLVQGCSWGDAHWGAQGRGPQRAALRERWPHAGEAGPARGGQRGNQRFWAR